jgi:hypothetical protein
MMSGGFALGAFVLFAAVALAALALSIVALSNGSPIVLEASGTSATGGVVRGSLFATRAEVQLVEGVFVGSCAFPIVEQTNGSGIALSEDGTTVTVTEDGVYSFQASLVAEQPHSPPASYIEAYFLVNGDTIYGLSNGVVGNAMWISNTTSAMAPSATFPLSSGDSVVCTVRWLGLTSPLELPGSDTFSPWKPWLSVLAL